jgi:hypothetical protein
LLSTGPMKFVISAVLPCRFILPLWCCADTGAGAGAGSDVGAGAGAGAGAGVGAGACRFLVSCRVPCVWLLWLPALPSRRTFALYCLSCLQRLRFFLLLDLGLYRPFLVFFLLFFFLFFLCSVGLPSSSETIPLAGLLVLKAPS